MPDTRTPADNNADTDVVHAVGEAEHWTRDSIDRAAPRILGGLADGCGANPREPDRCLACYAGHVLQIREGAGPADVFAGHPELAARHTTTAADGASDVDAGEHATEEDVGPGTVWIHVNGTRYQVLGTVHDANNTNTRPDRQVLYQRVDGNEPEEARLWYRELTEFLERFCPDTTAAHAPHESETGAGRCVWCRRTIATDTHYDRDHDEYACDTDPTTCWCAQYCWDDGGTDTQPCRHQNLTARELVAQLRQHATANDQAP